MKIFEINFNKLAIMLLPSIMRKPLVIALIKVCIKPIITLHTKLISFRSKNLYTLNHNGQVCHLRAVLNDAFDIDERGISIDDGHTNDYLLFSKKELFQSIDPPQPIWFRKAASTSSVPGRKTLHFTDVSNLALFSKFSTLGTIGFDFVVYLPTYLYDKIDLQRVIALVNYYKIASKRYQISTKNE